MSIVDGNIAEGNTLFTYILSIIENHKARQKPFFVSHLDRSSAVQFAENRMFVYNSNVKIISFFLFLKLQIMVLAF